MSNVHGLFSGKDDKDDSDDENNRFVGGIGDRGGGSGLAVQPNNMDDDPSSIFSRAENATSEDEGQVRRTITMYREGFVVDDGPYRRLDDPNNADFLRALAMGRTPPELASGGGNVVVGLVDKRTQDYVGKFRSFTGAGNSLGASTSSSTNGIFDPATLPETPPALQDGAPTTSIQIRLPNGKRKVIKLNLTMTVADLAAHLRDVSEGQSFRLVSGFPPKPLEDAASSVEAAGLKGAQVSLQKV